MLRFDPGDGRIATTRTLRRLGGRRRVQRRARAAALLRPAHGDRHRVRRQPGRAAARGSDPPGRRRPDATCGWLPYDGIGRERAQRAQLRRARLRRAGCPRLLRPRPHGGLGDASRATSTGSGSSARRRALVPLRRHLRGALAESAAARRARGDDGRAPARHGRLVRPQLPAVAVEGARRHRRRRPRRTARSSSRSTCCSATRRTSRPRSATRLDGVDESLTDLDVARLRAPARARCSTATRTSRSSRPRSARRTPRRSTTGARLQHARRLPSSARRCAGSRSSTASAAATRSPPG